VRAAAVVALLATAACASDPVDETGTTAPASSGAGAGPAACESSDDGETLRLAVGTELEPGGDATFCVRWTAPEPVDITSFVGTLGPSGHHALLLSLGDPTEPDGVGPCEEAALMDASTQGEFALLAGVSYETDGIRYDFPSSPVQIGLRVPAGSQIVFDAHFLNPGSEPLTTCAAMELDRGKPVVAALEFRTILPEAEYTLTVPAQGSIDVTYDVPVTESYRLAAASSHMHEGGTHFRMSIVETGKTLFETTTWAEPQPALYDSEKVVVEEGQTLRLECSFENGSATPQHFPQQMCVGGMYTLSCGLPGAC
jgi:hypothetical protein